MRRHTERSNCRRCQAKRKVKKLQGRLSSLGLSAESKITRMAEAVLEVNWIPEDEQLNRA